MKKLILAAAFLLTGIGVFAQKIGHVNVLEVISKMPEKKTADAEVEALSKKYQADLEMKGVSLQKKANEYRQKANTASQSQVAQWEQELQKASQNIDKMRTEAYKAVDKKRNELLQPILEKVQKVINKVAESKGINYVLDSSRDGVIVYEKGGNDLTPAVKKELGVQ